jgi:hypothetical protein
MLNTTLTVAAQWDGGGPLDVFGMSIVHGMTYEYPAVRLLHTQQASRHA